MKNRRYSELIQLPTFEERFEYLRLDGFENIDLSGNDRFWKQGFYHSNEWRQFRHHIIVRDNGCDLGIEGHEIAKGVYIFIHHLNPISLEDLQQRPEVLMNPENVISTILPTHNAIHYGDVRLLETMLIERTPNDTCPWKR